MSTVSAYAATSATEPLSKTTIERREVGPHDVAFDIHFAGICHSDIHTVRGEWGPVTYPMVPGHEIAGIVTEVGSEVSKFSVGDRVGVTPLLRGGRCGRRRAEHRHHRVEQRVVTVADPRRKSQHTFGFDEPCEFANLGARLDEDDAHVRQRRVEAVVGQAGGRRVGAAPRHRVRAGAASGDGEQLRSEVHAGDVRPACRRGQRCAAGTAAEIDHVGTSQPTSALHGVTELPGDVGDAFPDRVVAAGGPEARRRHSHHPATAAVTKVFSISGPGAALG